MLPPRTNVADRLTRIAVERPEQLAVVSMVTGATCTFGELDADATALARGFIELGVRPGTRLVLLVPPGVEFVKLVFALLRSGATTVLVDPGMGAKHLVSCLAAAAPAGFVAVSRAQAVRVAKRRRFPQARLNVTVGRRWFWGGLNYAQLLERGRASRVELPTTGADDAAAIIFTSGSTGPPKGVLYTHRMFDTQASAIQHAYDIQSGGVDLSCFALFGLFNSAWGVTTVFPEMDFSRPASADPRKLLAAANQWKITQAFASPAVWDKLSRRCKETGESIPTLRQVFSCGAPVPAAVLKDTLAMVHPDAKMHTPYGATECLPVSTIEAREVLAKTQAETARGAGVCVGRKFESIDWRVIGITDAPIADIDAAEECPQGEIGELIVRGPQVTPGYVVESRGARNEWQEERSSTTRNPKHKTRHSGWHRTGDVGYLDDQQRFWYCGRKAHRVRVAYGTLFTECCEAIINQHPAVRRSALVGVPAGEGQLQVTVVELKPTRRREFTDGAWGELVAELRAHAAAHEATQSIFCFLRHDNLPVDVRHNSKINREALAQWAKEQIAEQDLRHIMQLIADGAPPEDAPVAPTKLGRG
jgi:olefin beta-lactone synthetase